MRILVIGGTRFIGPPVVRRLAELGHDVTIVHRGETEADLPPSVGHVHVDRAQLQGHAAELRRLMPEVVLDLAAYSEQDARTVVEVFQGVARRVVVVSSQDVYRAYGRFHGFEGGALEPVPVAEDAPLRTALFPYRGKIEGLDDYEKILVERAATAAPELPATILRLPAVYGEGDYQHRLALELHLMDSRREILIDERLAGWRWTRAYVENIAAAIALAATDERAAGQTYNAGDHSLPYTEWLRAIGHAAGRSSVIRSVPSADLPAALQPPPGDYEQHLIADTTRIRQELGYQEVVTLEAGLRRAVAWERAQQAPLREP